MPRTAPQVIVIAGPNGAGKTSAAPSLLQDTVGIDAFINADVIAQGLSGFRPDDSAALAGRIVLRRLAELTDRRADFAFESTLSGRMFVALFRRWESLGYDRHVMYLWLPSADMAVERVRSRVGAGGHDIPESVVRRRFSRSLVNFFELYRRAATSWRLYDGSIPVGRRLIAAGDGDIRTNVADQHLWGIVQEQVREWSR